MPVERKSNISQQERSTLLEALARRYSAPLARYFARRTQHRNDIPDLVQEVLVRVSQVSDMTVIEKPEH
ncbi:hypothetical protein ACO1LA_14215, partial [Staphylococcus aureus]